MVEIKSRPPETTYYRFETEKDKNYAICACGNSNNLPFCDGSHSGTDKSPYIYKAPATKDVFICGCGKSGNKPHCDGSHKEN